MLSSIKRLFFPSNMCLIFFFFFFIFLNHSAFGNENLKCLHVLKLHPVFKPERKKNNTENLKNQSTKTNYKKEFFTYHWKRNCYIFTKLCMKTKNSDMRLPTCYQGTR